MLRRLTAVFLLMACHDAPSTLPPAPPPVVPAPPPIVPENPPIVPNQPPVIPPVDSSVVIPPRDTTTPATPPVDSTPPVVTSPPEIPLPPAPVRHDAAWLRVALLSAQPGDTVRVDSGETVVPIIAGADMGVGLAVPSGVTLWIPDGATLRTQPTALAHYTLILLDGERSTVTGGGRLVGDRGDHVGVGEHGFGVALRGATDGTVSRLTIDSMWGDGVYVDRGFASQMPTRHAVLSDLTIRWSRRNGISVVDADNTQILRTAVSDTHGTAPEAGIDLEPDAGKLVTGTLLQHVTLERNTGHGFQAGVGVAATTIDSLTADANGRAGVYLERLAGSIDLYGVTAMRNGSHGVQIELATALRLVNSTMRDNGGAGLYVARQPEGSGTGLTFGGNGRSGIYPTAQILITGDSRDLAITRCTAAPVADRFRSQYGLFVDAGVRGVSVTACDLSNVSDQAVRDDSGSVSNFFKPGGGE